MSVELVSPAGTLVTAPEALAEKLVAQGFTHAPAESSAPAEDQPRRSPRGRK